MLVSYSDKNFISHPTARFAEWFCPVCFASVISSLDRCVDLVAAFQSFIVPHISSGFGQALPCMESHNPLGPHGWDMVH
jgi:hypothetical protein